MVRRTGERHAARVSHAGAQTRRPSPFKSAKGKAAYLAAYESTMQLWPVPYEDRYIPGRYGRTHVVAAGPQDAPALVLIHGDFFSLTMWAANIADFSREHRVYALDVVGQPGKSVPDQPVRTREDATAWISEVLDGLGLERATLVGMSYGGWFSLNYAMCAPPRLDRLVLLSPGGCFLSERPTFYLNALPAMILPFLPRRLLFDRCIRSITFAENLRDPHTRLINDRLAEQVYLGWRHFRIWKHWGSQNIKPHVFPDEELRSMVVPTLLLIGQQEALYDPVAALERARKLVPNLAGELVPRANHDMTVGQHEIVDRRVLAFLKGGPTSSPRTQRTD